MVALRRCSFLKSAETYGQCVTGWWKGVYGAPVKIAFQEVPKSPSVGIAFRGGVPLGSEGGTGMSSGSRACPDVRGEKNKQNCGHKLRIYSCFR